MKHDSNPSHLDLPDSILFYHLGLVRAKPHSVLPQGTGWSAFAYRVLGDDLEQAFLFFKDADADHQSMLAEFGNTAVSQYATQKALVEGNSRWIGAPEKIEATACKHIINWIHQHSYSVLYSRSYESPEVNPFSPRIEDTVLTVVRSPIWNATGSSGGLSV